MGNILDEAYRRLDGELNGVVCGERGAERESREGVTLLKPATGLEISTNPIRLEQGIGEGIEYTAALGPKTLEGGVGKFTGDDLCLVFGKVFGKVGRRGCEATWILTEQLDGISSSDPDRFADWLDAQTDKNWPASFCTPRARAMVDTLLAFRRAEAVSLDRDALAVLQQREFYSLSEKKSPFFTWCQRMNAKITSGLNEAPPRFWELVLEKKMHQALMDLARTRQIFGSRLRNEFPSRDRYFRGENLKADSIFTGALTLVLETARSRRRSVASFFTRSLADSIIYWTARINGKQTSDVLCQNTNAVVDELWNILRETDPNAYQRMRPLFFDKKIYTLYATALRSPYLSSCGGIDPERHALDLSERAYGFWDLGHRGGEVGIFQFSDGFLDLNRSGGPSSFEIDSSVRGFLSNPQSVAAGRASSSPDDWVISGLTISG